MYIYIYILYIYIYTMVGKIAVVHLLWTTQEYAQLPSQDL